MELPFFLFKKRGRVVVLTGRRVGIDLAECRPCPVLTEVNTLCHSKAIFNSELKWTSWTSKHWCTESSPVARLQLILYDSFKKKDVIFNISSPLNPGGCVVLTLIFNSSQPTSLHSLQIREAERPRRDSFSFSSVYNLVFPLSPFNMRAFNKPLDTLHRTLSCQLYTVYTPCFMNDHHGSHLVFFSVKASTSLSPRFRVILSLIPSVVKCSWCVWGVFCAAAGNKLRITGWDGYSPGLVVMSQKWRWDEVEISTMFHHHQQVQKESNIYSTKHLLDGDATSF